MSTSPRWNDTVLRPGVYLVHKPVGVTSHSIVRELLEAVRSAPGKRLPLCHGGTLDPFAEGLLLLLAGQATRLMDRLHALPKRYVAEVRWGSETDNGDPGGKVTFEGPAPHLTPELLDHALEHFLGWREQVPPLTSAKKVDGEPAYKKAHRGESFELPPSKVYLHRARWLHHTLPERSTLELTCRGGYYVRALARDLGRRLGCGAHLSRLNRTGIGPWDDPGPGQRVELHGLQLGPWWPARDLTDAELGTLRQGGVLPAGTGRAATWRLPPGFPAMDPLVRGFHLGSFTALLKPKGNGLEMDLELRGGL